MKVFSPVKKKGFTLLEVIIVIIILAVLATLALPSLFASVEFARANEALNATTALRGSIERCYVMRNQSYTGCQTMTNLDIADPGSGGQAHFTYAVTTGASVYTIRATRSTLNGGVTTSWINYVVTATGVTRSGGSAFAGIQ